MDPGPLLDDLDETQRHAVTTGSRLVAVIAGAGSGKTRVLTRRVAYRVMTDTADAARCLVLTFTREAAGEIARRLPRLGLHERVTAGTFHSVSRQLLAQRWNERGESAPTITSDRRGLLGQAIHGHVSNELANEIDFALARGWSPDYYRDAVRSGTHRSSLRTDTVADALIAYRNIKLARHLIDLDDVLRLTVELLDRDGEFAEVCRWRFRHLHVDEAQDLNPLQHRLIDGLRVGNDDLYLVGDPAQAIYGFNGADPSLLLDVSARFPGIEVIRLPTNHRSTPQIVEAGRFVLARGDQPTELRAQRDDAAPVDVIGHADETAEAEAVATRIAALDPHLLTSGNVAVLARTHAALEPVRAALARRGIPVRRPVDAPGSPISPHIRQIYRLANPNQVREWAQDRREMVEESGDHDLGAVVTAVFEFLRVEPTGTGTEFERWVDLTNPFGVETTGVDVMTFHGAKGREWHTVFVVGVETGLVPHNSAKTKHTKAEEARLLYVAVTRATDRSIINWAERRGGYQRKLTPLLETFESSVQPAVAPPDMVGGRRGSSRSVSLQRLRGWRAHTARVGGVLPQQVMSDRQLSLVAQHHPASADELANLLGIGTMTASSLFPGIDDALRNAEP